MHAVGGPVLEVAYGTIKIASAARGATAPSAQSRLPGTTACVAVHNGAGVIGRCLDALLAGDLDHIVVVDDASTDGTADLVRARYPAVELIRLAHNNGPAAARNAAFATARTPRVLFVDADVELDAACMTTLHEALDAAPTSVMAMPRVLDAGDPLRVHYDGASAHFVGLMTPESRGARDDGTCLPVRATGSVISSCVLLDTERWGAAEPFDSVLGHTYEDHDLGLRARLHGWDILSVPAARCMHGSGTPGLSVRGSDEAPPRRMHLLFRNRWRIILKTYRVRTFVVLAPALLCSELALFAAAVRKGWLRAWLGALRWNMAHLPDTLRVRRALQSQRRCSDAELLTAGPLPVRPGVAATRMQRAALRALERMMIGYWMLARRLL